MTPVRENVSNCQGTQSVVSLLVFSSCCPADQQHFWGLQRYEIARPEGMFDIYGRVDRHSRAAAAFTQNRTAQDRKKDRPQIACNPATVAHQLRFGRIRENRLVVRSVSSSGLRLMGTCQPQIETFPNFRIYLPIGCLFLEVCPSVKPDLLLLLSFFSSSAHMYLSTTNR